MRALAPFRLLPVLAVLIVAACTQFPELDAATSPGAAEADFPELIPLDAALASAASTGPLPEDTRAAIEARAAALRARAAALRARDLGQIERLRDAAQAG